MKVFVTITAEDGERIHFKVLEEFTVSQDDASSDEALAVSVMTYLQGKFDVEPGMQHR